MPISRPRKPAGAVARFQNIPIRMAASRGAMKKLKSACT